MSYMSTKLLSEIQNKYKNRLNADGDNASKKFSKEALMDEYHYSNEVFEAATSELKKYGYIRKWVTGDFELIVD